VPSDADFRKFHICLHVAVYVAFFFVFDRDQASETLAMQLLGRPERYPETGFEEISG
jgi:hypothetical protein